MNGSFNPGSLLKEIVPRLAISVDVHIKVGFSFIGVKYEKLQPKYSYFFAAQDLCTIKGTFLQREEAMSFAEDLEKRNYIDFLQETFFSTESGERFTHSRIGPFCLVACYIWISK